MSKERSALCVPVLMHFTPPGNTFFAVLFSSLPASLRPYMQQPPCRYHAGRQVHAALARSSRSALLFPKVDGRDLLPEEDSDGEIPEDQLYLRAVLASEMMAVDSEMAEQAVSIADDEEASIGRHYGLSDEQQSSTLKRQLCEMAAWRTEVGGGQSCHVPTLVMLGFD